MPIRSIVSKKTPSLIAIAISVLSYSSVAHAQTLDGTTTSTTTNANQGYASTAAQSSAQHPPPTWPRLGGHFGAALPIVAISSDDPAVTAIGRDFANVGLVPGIQVKLDEHWAIDFEFVGYSRWTFGHNGTTMPLDTVSTLFVVDPGVVYNFGPIAIGLRAAVQLGAGVPYNFGMIPIINKTVPIGGRTNWYFELDLPVFVTGEPSHAAVTFGPQIQTGVAF